MSTIDLLEIRNLEGNGKYFTMPLEKLWILREKKKKKANYFSRMNIAQIAVFSLPGRHCEFENRDRSTNELLARRSKIFAADGPFKKDVTLWGHFRLYRNSSGETLVEFQT